MKLRLPAETQARLDALEAAEDYDSAEYQGIMMDVLYPLYMCRTTPWPEPVTRAFGLSNQTIYNHMQGKSEFVVTGNMRGWERWDRLHEIEVRALTLGGEHDTMDPRDLEKMAQLMPNAICAICPEGSHLAMWDDQAFYFEHLLRFLKSL